MWKLRLFQRDWEAKKIKGKFNFSVNKGIKKFKTIALFGGGGRIKTL